VNTPYERNAGLTQWALYINHYSEGNVVYTDKKENKIFLINKEIHSGAVAKSYMRKGFLLVPNL
jgi:hypothetical protein